jgi:hypothetical protein
MELKLVGSNNNNIKTTELEKFLNECKTDSFYYFHRDTSYKNLMDLIDKLKEEKGFSVYFREVKYGLDENDYMYEMHTL